jgi:hypothetical protein
MRQEGMLDTKGETIENATDLVYDDDGTAPSPHVLFEAK